MSVALTSQDAAALLSKLGMTEEEAKELEENGITLEEYASMMGADLAAEAQETTMQYPRYSVVHAVQLWQNEATGETTQTITGVPVHFGTIRAFFVKGIDRPVCSSTAGKTGKYIDIESGEVLNRECATCPLNQWPQGGGAKPCKEMRRIFLQEPEKDLPVVVSLPPTSIKTWDAYVSAAAYQGAPVLQRVVELTLEKKVSGEQMWSVLAKPKTVRRLSPMEYIKVRKIKEEIEEAARKAEVEAVDYFQEENPAALSEDQ